MTAHRFIGAVGYVELTARTGRVQRILPTYVEADGPNAPLGCLCEIEAGGRATLAEVVGVNSRSVILAPFEDSGSTVSGARVRALTAGREVAVGDAFLGRAIDALGRPIDGLGRVRAQHFAPLDGETVTPLDRVSPQQVLETGVRAIDGLLTLGHGQRVGVFAASGVGKTSLMAQLARQVRADRVVICLVGERGREVEAMWSEGLAPETKARATMIAATSDQTAAMRARAGDYALALADHWRREGRHVLLLLDSVTRLAMALREIGLAAGEPPTVRAYTPSVFSAIPKLVERCGALRSGGSITAIMTVLSETDDVDDPVSEMMKSLLDGHIVLSRTLAEQGHFPAIDAPRSISRLASGLMDKRHRTDAETALQLLSTYEASRTLIETGVYARGGSRDIDRALERRPALLEFLRQRQDEQVTWPACGQALAAAVGA